MHNKRFIFLDIDGVLNSNKWYTGLFKKYDRSELKNWSFNRYNIDTDATQLLNQLEGCEVVISSSWTYCAETCSGLIDAGLKLPIIGGTNQLEVREHWINRGNSILKWFHDNNYGTPRDIFFKDGWYDTHVTFGGTLKDIAEDTEEVMIHDDNIKITYVIFDDSTDMLYDQKDHFINVNSFIGLTQDDINKAKKILNLNT